VYAVVPPDGFAVKVTAVPTVPVAGPVIVTVRGVPDMEIVADAVAVTALASVIVTETVLLPFTE
jgi:hypothetical protein